MPVNNQYFNLRLDTAAPAGASISFSSTYHNKAATLTLASLSPTDVPKFMKVWVSTSETATASEAASLAWKPWATSDTVTFTTEGDNWAHAIFMDEVGNETTTPATSGKVIYDKTKPVISAFTINNGDASTSNKTVAVKVTAVDNPGTAGATVSDIDLSTFSGAINADATRALGQAGVSVIDGIVRATWSDEDRTAGYKQINVVLSDNAAGVKSESKTIYATVADRAGNASERSQSTITLIDGAADPIMLLLDNAGSAIGAHYNLRGPIKLQYKVCIGETALVTGLKWYGDITTTPSSETPTAEPTEWITPTWEAETKSYTISSLYFTNVNGNKVVQGKAKYDISGKKGEVATKAALEALTGMSDGDIYTVQSDETHSNENTVYLYRDAKWNFFGTVTDVPTVAVNTLDSVTVHNSIATPSLTMTRDKAQISDVVEEGKDYNKVTFTVTFNSDCKIGAYKILAYNTKEAADASTYSDDCVIAAGVEEKSETGTWSPYAVTADILTKAAGAGTKHFVAWCKNLCGNMARTDISIDTTVEIVTEVPAGTITPDAYYGTTKIATETVTVNTTITSTHTPTKMQAWVDNTADTTTVPAAAITSEPIVNPTPVTKFAWTTAEDGVAYFHIKYFDNLGHSAVVHSTQTTLDRVIPTVTITTDAYHTTTSCTLTIAGTDPTPGSGVNVMKIWGDIQGATTEPETWESYATTKSVNLTTGDGTKTIHIKVKDKAENVSADTTCTTTLDQTAPSAVLTLRNAADTADLPALISDVNFTAHVGPTVTTPATTDVAYYKLYGDVVGKSTEEGVDWVAYVAETGQNYMKVSGLAFTAAAGLKTVKIKLKDSAGNVSPEVSMSTTLETEKPNIDVEGVDYNIVSKIGTAASPVPRKDATAADIPNTSCDKMTFKFSCGKKLVAYKVCVNEAGQEAETAVQIGTTHGSINMSGGTVEADAKVSCTIRALDYAATSKVADTDGVYEVIVYGKSESGLWSPVHVITG